MKKMITIIALFLITSLSYSQPFPNRTVEAGNLNLNYGFAAHTKTISATTYTVTEDDYAVITTTDACIISLPTPSLNFLGKTYVIKSSGAAVASVVVTGGANIDAAATKTVTAGKSLIIQSDVKQYWILSYNKYTKEDYLLYDEKYFYFDRNRSRKK